jgi:hypothetical protein
MPVYRMGGELVDEKDMKRWHNDRGMPWGSPYEGPDPVTVRRQRMPWNISVHLTDEHGIEDTEERQYMEHAFAHVHGVFRKGQEHYHDA